MIIELRKKSVFAYIILDPSYYMYLITMFSVDLNHFLSTYIVSFSTVSINFLGFTRDGKKSAFDCLIKDRALS